MQIFRELMPPTSEKFQIKPILEHRIYFAGIRELGSLAVGVRRKVVYEIAALHAAAPDIRARCVAIFAAMQPFIVDWALQGVRARLLNHVGVFRRAVQDEISIARVVAHTAPVRTAMIRRFKAEVAGRFRGLIFHDAAVTWAYRFQMGTKHRARFDVH